MSDFEITAARKKLEGGRKSEVETLKEQVAALIKQRDLYHQWYEEKRARDLATAKYRRRRDAAI